MGEVKGHYAEVNTSGLRVNLVDEILPVSLHEDKEVPEATVLDQDPQLPWNDGI